MTLPLDVFAEYLEQDLFHDLPARTIISLCSPATASDRATRHIPMLDFGLTANTANDKLIYEAADLLNLSGALFASGKSYHYFGAPLLSDGELVRQLARAQLASPLIDQRWAAHQLIDGACRLRISTDVERHKTAHTLVGHLP